MARRCRSPRPAVVRHGTWGRRRGLIDLLYLQQRHGSPLLPSTTVTESTRQALTGLLPTAGPVELTHVPASLIMRRQLLLWCNGAVALLLPNPMELVARIMSIQTKSVLDHAHLPGAIGQG